MSKASVTVMLGTLLALGATLVLVPSRRGVEQLAPVEGLYALGGVEAGWVWEMGEHRPYTIDKSVAPNTHTGPPRTFRSFQRPVWGWIVVEQLAVLLVGGGLLTWMVQRDRRRHTAVS